MGLEIQMGWSRDGDGEGGRVGNGDGDGGNTSWRGGRGQGMKNRMDKGTELCKDGDRFAGRDWDWEAWTLMETGRDRNEREMGKGEMRKGMGTDVKTGMGKMARMGMGGGGGRGCKV